MFCTEGHCENPTVLSASTESHIEARTQLHPYKSSPWTTNKLSMAKSPSPGLTSASLSEPRTSRTSLFRWTSLFWFLQNQGKHKHNIIKFNQQVTMWHTENSTVHREQTDLILWRRKPYPRWPAQWYQCIRYWSEWCLHHHVAHWERVSHLPLQPSSAPPWWDSPSLWQNCCKEKEIWVRIQSMLLLIQLFQETKTPLWPEMST